MDEKVEGKCDRCCGSTNNVTIMSKFNKDIICIPCSYEEKMHPQYGKAIQAEIKECFKGNLNYEGIGLPYDLVKKHKKM